MDTSKKIKARLKEAGKRFWAGDNIADFIEDGEKQDLIDELAVKFEDVLQGLVIDTENDPNSNDTGTTLKGINDIVTMEGMADNVKYIVLLEKMSSDFSTQICAKELDEEESKQWIVFPYEEWWNNKTGEQSGN